MDLRSRAASELEAARRRSNALLECQPEAELVRQHSPLMSPLVWDLAHVVNYEEIWLLRALGAEAVRPDCDPLYDPMRNPRSARSSLDLLTPGEARSYGDTVRSRVLDILGSAELPRVHAGAGQPPLGATQRPRTEALLEEAFVYGMVAQHEHQHDETMLATIQLSDGACTLPPARATPPGNPNLPGEVLIEASPFLMGTDSDPWAYDNERPAHVVHLPAFWIDTAPVTNMRYRDFVEDGGYRNSRWWSPEGWEWRNGAAAEHPEFWHRHGPGSWSVRRFGRRVDLPLLEPVQHVCWYEADAFARWAGKRLPNEQEWEKAASWRPGGAKLRYPWGDEPPRAAHANLGQAHLGPVPVGAYPAGVSPLGCHQMLGDVWEWTSSDWAPYPGFCPFPYREYSQVFFGSDYKVLRGGSWATHPSAARNTFRNWDFPVRRQIFAGFRCARDEPDAEPSAWPASDAERYFRPPGPSR